MAKSDCSSLNRGVRLVGLGLLVDRSLARVLDRQGRDDDEHLAGAAEPAGLDDHPAEPRVERQPGQRRPVCREPASAPTVPPAALVPGGEGPSSSSSRTPSATWRSSGGSTNGKRAMSPRPSEVIWRMTEARVVRWISGSVNSGRPRSRPRSRAGCRCRRRDATAPAGALVGTGLADRLDRQALHLGALAVARDAGGAGVDDVADARHGQRGLGDVGGQHDPAAAAPAEDPVLLGRRQPGEERQHLGVAAASARSGRRRRRGSRARPRGRRGCRWPRGSGAPRSTAPRRPRRRR